MEYISIRRKESYPPTPLTSITNCPAYVPVIVEDCPAARIPIAQMYIAISPYSQPKKTPPL